jgi:hypothetical protein
VLRLFLGTEISTSLASTPILSNLSVMSLAKLAASATPVPMSKKLEIFGENRTIPFIREACDVMNANPQRYGNVGYKILKELPTLTVNSFDLSLLLLEPA